MPLLRCHVVRTGGCAPVVHRETPQPRRLRIRRLVETSRERGGPVRVEDVREPRLVLVGVHERQRRHEPASLVVHEPAVCERNPLAGILIDERLKCKHRLRAVARVRLAGRERSAPREVLQPRPVVHERRDERSRPGPRVQLVPSFLAYEPQDRAPRDVELLALAKFLHRLDRPQAGFRAVERKRRVDYHRRTLRRTRPHRSPIETFRLDLLAVHHQPTHRELSPERIAAERERLLEKRFPARRKRVVRAI